ncbi:tRNA (adenine(22)-N(1))-methyltransferase [Pseudomonas sp. PSKL.D1]|uniref:tRNA (adenine(22)-N(1))-methyltransferase n=1 Tax=Pseudomonas sp. PSKL.D1 TaxID=3029060 RepID=UPI00238164A0|nr:tRNA (adenine(22)-N(1))-methyltransferase TrmK [Pseudomonas sp. PSKL.D1]WDY55651.1 tRNA (adenine(22)-N(1))-methyltransferase TrmK [Pseudomonas sp. PSKL.D1]
MNEQTLSLRLERVAAHVPQGARLADIGSDHGYLPVALALRGVIAAGVAGEVAQTPYESALRNVRRNGLQAHITVRLADGLEALEPEDCITAISLCGMGGETMCEILTRGKARLNGRERMILQPNGGEHELRTWLMHNGYRIVSEELLRENRFDYEIIVAEPDAASVYSPEELYFGPVLMREKSPAFIAKWQRVLRQQLQTIANFERAQGAVPLEKQQRFARQVGWINQVLA